MSVQQATNAGTPPTIQGRTLDQWLSSAAVDCEAEAWQRGTFDRVTILRLPSGWWALLAPSDRTWADAAVDDGPWSLEQLGGWGRWIVCWDAPGGDGGPSVEYDGFGAMLDALRAGAPIA